ncbi:hypothetical protein GCM10023321_58690 [Pseudonocardia eucalypti]|uniref:Zinc finger protein n=1 Tax=Pseudonocardia eucalypti TaxID=648755 RepID=A0ABP9QT39_9PSEU
MSRRADSARDPWATPDASPQYILWIASVGQIEHCITFAQYAATHKARHGTYQALCGARFTSAAPRSTPLWPHCRDCTHRLRRWTETWHAAQRTAGRGRLQLPWTRRGATDA